VRGRVATLVLDSAIPAPCQPMLKSQAIEW